MLQSIQFFVKWKNNQAIGKHKIIVRPTKRLRDLLMALWDLGFIKNIKTVGEKFEVEFIELEKHLKWVNISKPGRLIYENHKQLQRRNASVVLVSTTEGVLEAKEAVQRGLGGLVLFSLES